MGSIRILRVVGRTGTVTPSLRSCLLTSLVSDVRVPRTVLFDSLRRHVEPELD